MIRSRDYSAFLPLTPEEFARLMRSIRVEENGCWLWTGWKDAAGYGLAIVKGNRVAVHRLMCEAFNGHIPEGYVVDHLCRVRACCNPKHLEAVTQRINNQRAPKPIGADHHFGAREQCVNGHPFTGDNLRLAPRPAGVLRMCRECARIGQAIRKRRKLAALSDYTGLTDIELVPLARKPLRDLRQAGLLP